MSLLEFLLNPIALLFIKAAAIWHLRLDPTHCQNICLMVDSKLFCSPFPSTANPYSMTVPICYLFKCLQSFPCRHLTSWEGQLTHHTPEKSYIKEEILSAFLFYFTIKIQFFPFSPKCVIFCTSMC